MAFWGQKESTCSFRKHPVLLRTCFSGGLMRQSYARVAASNRESARPRGAWREGCSRGEHAKRKTGGRGWGQSFGPRCHVNPSSSVCAQGFFCTGVLLLETKANKKLLQPAMKKTNPPYLLWFAKQNCLVQDTPCHRGPSFIRTFLWIIGYGSSTVVIGLVLDSTLTQGHVQDIR